MDKCSSDAEFDSYWDYEAKNKNRNRIRVGRQYQATIPPLLKPGEKDGRRCEDLETLKWKPHELTDSNVEQYLSMARSVTSFSKSIEKCREPEQTAENFFQTAIKELAEFVTSHHPCQKDTDCKVPESFSHGECSSSSSTSPKPSPVNDWTAPETYLFAQAVETCGKNFCTIKKEYLPWKPVRSLIEYYYYYCKGEKPDNSTAKVPSVCTNEIEKDEPVASCSHEPDEVTHPSTKEEHVASEELKEETELQATPVDTSTSEDCKNIKLEPVKEMEQEAGEDDGGGDDNDESGSTQSTVGSLKFFLGGRLVLKLNAQQDGSSGTRCQWVQSTEMPKHLFQIKKKLRKKSTSDEQQVNIVESQQRKKVVDSVTSRAKGNSPVAKKAKLKSFNIDTEFPPLCSASWTPPVADGQDSFEVDDASSKTSEGCVSPVVIGPRGMKTEVRTETPVDIKQKFSEPTDIVQDRKQPWIKSEPLAVPCASHYESSVLDDRQSQNVSPKSLGEDYIYNQDLLNHRSALSHLKSAAYVPRAVHSSSPSAKLFNKRPSPSADLQDKMKASPSFHSPTSLSCSTSSESSARESVLDLSRPEHCRSRDMHASHQQSYCHISPTGCNENVSSSEGSPHTPCSTENSVLFCKSSNCGAYHKDLQVPVVESKDAYIKTCRKRLNVNQLPNANGAAECTANCCTEQNDTRMNCEQCTCCLDPTIPCSPKCCKTDSPQEHLCNKEGHATSSPNQGVMCTQSANNETHQQHLQKLIPWFGAPTSALLQLYPQCYPYYVAYGMNPSAVPESPADIPLDLSSNGNSKGDETVQETMPDGQANLSKSNADALERGMLYQLLKSKVTK